MDKFVVLAMIPWVAVFWHLRPRKVSKKVNPKDIEVLMEAGLFQVVKGPYQEDFPVQLCFPDLQITLHVFGGGGGSRINHPDGSCTPLPAELYPIIDRYYPEPECPSPVSKS